MNYFIGVDGGGTKTEYALFDDKKKMVASIKTAGSNHENYEGAFDEASEIIWEGLNKLVNQAGISLDDVQFTLMGLAGIDHPFQYEMMCNKLKEFGLSNFEIFNDGFIVVKAGSKTGAAIGYNCGTGTCCNAIDSTGQMLQLAGLGDFSGDISNGHWIAINAFKMIYDDVYLGLNKTAMTQLFYKKYNIEHREQFIASLAEIEGENAEQFIRDLIDIFFGAVNADDPPALDCIEKMATRGAQLILSHTNQLIFNGDFIEVVLSGSIHTKLPSEKYIDLMEKKVRALSNRDFKFIRLDRPPVVGCINWIFQDYL